MKTVRCRKNSYEQLFAQGRQKLEQEIDLITFLKHFDLMRGAIKSLTTKDERRMFRHEARYNVIFNDQSDYLSRSRCDQVEEDSFCSDSDDFEKFAEALKGSIPA